MGIDTFHHTFLKCLEWSFGDYYKQDAIKWAWELLTDVWGLDKNRLWVTVYKDDQEAMIYGDQTDINEDRVLWFGKKENFGNGRYWPMRPMFLKFIIILVVIYQINLLMV